MNHDDNTLYPQLPDGKEILYDGGDANDALPKVDKGGGVGNGSAEEKTKAKGLVEDDIGKDGIIGNEGSRPIAVDL